MRTLPALGVLCLALAGCGGSSPDGADPAAAPGAAGTGASAGTSAGAGAGDATAVEGTTFRFDLPSAPRFREQQPVTTEHGAVKRTWRYAVRPEGPFCTVVAVEQPSFTQAFPQSVLAVFDATNSGTGEKVVRNTPIDPVAGTTGGVAQEATFAAKLDNGTSVPARIYQRQFLTPGLTLVSVSAAGPQDQVGACGLEAVVESLRVTGSELPAASPSGSG